MHLVLGIGSGIGLLAGAIAMGALGGLPAVEPEAVEVQRLARAKLPKAHRRERRFKALNRARRWGPADSYHDARRQAPPPFCINPVR